MVYHKKFILAGYLKIIINTFPLCVELAGTRSNRTVHRRLLFNINMEMLPSSRRILSTIGICSLPDGSPFRLKVFQMASAILVLVIYIVGTWYTLYCLEHYQIGDIDENWFALIQLIGCVPAIASFISLIYQMGNTRDYLDEIQKIFNKCNCELDPIFLRFRVQIISNFIPDENTPSARIYEQTNSVCEIFIKWSITFVTSLYLMTLFFGTAAGILYYYLKDGHVETENLHLLVKMK